MRCSIRPSPPSEQGSPWCFNCSSSRCQCVSSLCEPPSMKNTVVIRASAHLHSKHEFVSQKSQIPQYFDTYGRCMVVHEHSETTATHLKYHVVLKFADPAVANRVKQKYNGRVLFGAGVTSTFLSYGQLKELNLTQEKWTDIQSTSFKKKGVSRFVSKRRKVFESKLPKTDDQRRRSTRLSQPGKADDKSGTDSSPVDRKRSTRQSYPSKSNDRSVVESAMPDREDNRRVTRQSYSGKDDDKNVAPSAAPEEQRRSTRHSYRHSSNDRSSERNVAESTEQGQKSRDNGRSSSSSKSDSRKQEEKQDDKRRRSSRLSYAHKDDKDRALSSTAEKEDARRVSRRSYPSSSRSERSLVVSPTVSEHEEKSRRNSRTSSYSSHKEERSVVISPTIVIDREDKQIPRNWRNQRSSSFEENYRQGNKDEERALKRERQLIPIPVEEHRQRTNSSSSGGSYHSSSRRPTSIFERLGPRHAGEEDVFTDASRGHGMQDREKRYSHDRKRSLEDISDKDRPSKRSRNHDYNSQGDSKSHSRRHSPITPDSVDRHLTTPESHMMPASIEENSPLIIIEEISSNKSSTSCSPTIVPNSPSSSHKATPISATHIVFPPNPTVYTINPTVTLPPSSSSTLPTPIGVPIATSSAVQMYGNNQYQVYTQYSGFYPTPTLSYGASPAHTALPTPPDPSYTFSRSRSGTPVMDELPETNPVSISSTLTSTSSSTFSAATTPLVNNDSGKVLFQQGEKELRQIAVTHPQQSESFSASDVDTGRVQEQLDVKQEHLAHQEAELSRVNCDVTATVKIDTGSQTDSASYPSREMEFMNSEIVNSTQNTDSQTGTIVVDSQIRVDTKESQTDTEYLMSHDNQTVEANKDNPTSPADQPLETNHMNTTAEEQIEEQMEEQREEQMEEQREEQMEEQREEQMEEQREEQMEEQREEQIEEQREEQIEKQREEQIEEQREEQIEEQKEEQIEEQREEQIEEQREEQIEEQREEQIEEQREVQMEEQREEQIEEQREEEREETESLSGSQEEEAEEPTAEEMSPLATKRAPPGIKFELLKDNALQDFWEQGNILASSCKVLASNDPSMEDCVVNLLESSLKKMARGLLDKFRNEAKIMEE